MDELVRRIEQLEDSNETKHRQEQTQSTSPVIFVTSEEEITPEMQRMASMIIIDDIPAEDI